MSRSAFEMYNRIKCPKCGGDAELVFGEADWWTITCLECGHSKSKDPTAYLDVIFPKWVGGAKKLKDEDIHEQKV